MSHRTEQIASTLRRNLAEVLMREMNDPRLEGAMVSVTEVKVSPDHHWAEVYISVLPEGAQTRVLHALRHASRHLHSLLRKRLPIRVVPKLDFRLDKTIKRQAEIFDAIHEGLHRSGPADGPQSDEEDTDESIGDAR